MWNPARPALRTRARTPVGTTPVTNVKMLRPPYSRKISVNSISSAPVTISVTVAAVDTAPLVNRSWLSRSASSAESRNWLICCSLTFSGPSVSQAPTPSMLVETWPANAGTPSMNWVMTNASRPPNTANPLSSTSATAPLRGAPLRSRKSTTGMSSAATIVASATGTNRISNRRINHPNATTAARMISSRHAHAAVLRTSGVTDSSASGSREGPADIPVA